MRKIFNVTKNIVNNIIFAVQLLFFLITTTVGFSIVSISALFSLRLSHLFLRLLGKPILSIFFSLQIEGEEYLEKSGKMILAGNHTGVLDSVILEIVCKRPIIFLFGSWMPKFGLIGWLIRRNKSIPITKGRGIEALNQAVIQLNKGNIIVIFPEGGTSPDGKISRFREGVSYIHKKSMAPIIPFVIQGGYEAWTWRKKLPKFKKVIIQFGPIFCDLEDNERIITKKLQDKIQFMKDALEKREQAKLG